MPLTALDRETAEDWRRRIDAEMKVLGMEEKPQVSKSHWAVPPFYIYGKKDLELVNSQNKQYE